MSNNIEDNVVLKPFDAVTSLEVIELSGEAGRLRAENARLAAEIERLTKERDEARRTVKMAHEEGARQIATLQARIDELMLEYCPEEMTPEQLDEWARHQIPAPEANL